MRWSCGNYVLHADRTACRPRSSTMALSHTSGSYGALLALRVRKHKNGFHGADRLSSQIPRVRADAPGSIRQHGSPRRDRRRSPGGPEPPSGRCRALRVQVPPLQGCPPRRRGRVLARPSRPGSSSPRNGPSTSAACSSSAPPTFASNGTQELEEKFFLPCRILERKSYDAILQPLTTAIRSRATMPSPSAPIQFAYRQGRLCRSGAIGSDRHRRGPSPAQRLEADEQDRLRPSTAPPHRSPKLLLTATPLAEFPS